MLTEQRVFSAEVNAVPSDYANVPGLLNRLRERDVLLAFVESYGVSAIDDPRYSSVLRPRLDDLTRRIADAQLSLATGRLLALELSSLASSSEADSIRDSSVCVLIPLAVETILLTVSIIL